MIDARRFLESLATVIDGVDNERKQIYRIHPHEIMNNCFSGDKMCDWIGQNRFSATMTCRGDILPAGVSVKY